MRESLNEETSRLNIPNGVTIGLRAIERDSRAAKGRILTFVANHEPEGVRFLNSVAGGRRSHADEASHWDSLHAHNPTKRIDHSLAYSDQTCTNQAESYFSRLRRVVQGQHHFVGLQHLHQHATMTLGMRTIAGLAMAGWPTARRCWRFVIGQPEWERLLAAKRLAEPLSWETGLSDH